MAQLLKFSEDRGRKTTRRPLSTILRGFRFRVCESQEDRDRAFEVRRQVYVGECGYDIPVPDEYDARSWVLIAEDMATGEAVGTLRITPRWAGSLEAEEYFELPEHLNLGHTVEMTRFAVLPAYRTRSRIIPIVWAGLLKLALRFSQHLDASHVVACSTPERVFTYAWLKLCSSGVRASYRKLGGAEHELMFGDLREVGHIPFFKEAFLDVEHPEITVPRWVSQIPVREEAGERHVAEAGAR